MTASPAHRYHARCHWQGSTAAGCESYDRAHRGAVPPARGPIDLSADAAFRGGPQRCNPEQLLVLAAASCQLLSLLAMVRWHLRQLALGAADPRAGRGSPAYG